MRNISIYSALIFSFVSHASADADVCPTSKEIFDNVSAALDDTFSTKLEGVLQNKVVLKYPGKIVVEGPYKDLFKDLTREEQETKAGFKCTYKYQDKTILTITVIEDVTKKGSQ